MDEDENSGAPWLYPAAQPVIEISLIKERDKKLADDHELTDEALRARAGSVGGEADANNAAEADNTAVGKQVLATEATSVSNKRKQKRKRGDTDGAEFREVTCFICYLNFNLETGLDFPASYGYHPRESGAFSHSLASHAHNPLFEGVNPTIYYINSIERWFDQGKNTGIDFETRAVYVLVVKGLVSTYLCRTWGTMTVGGSTHILSDCQFHFTQWLSYLKKVGMTVIGKIIKQVVSDMNKSHNSNWKNNKVGIVEQLGIDTKKKKNILSIIQSIVYDLGIKMRDVHRTCKIELCGFVEATFQNMLIEEIVSVLKERQILQDVWGLRLLQRFANTIQNRLVGLGLAQDKNLIESMKKTQQQAE